MIIFTLIGHKPLAYKGFHFPEWCDAIGWVLALSSVSMIPGMAIYQIATTPGTLYQVQRPSLSSHRSRKPVTEQFRYVVALPIFIYFHSSKKYCILIHSCIFSALISTVSTQELLVLRPANDDTNTALVRPTADQDRYHAGQGPGGGGSGGGGGGGGGTRRPDERRVRLRERSHHQDVGRRHTARLDGRIDCVCLCPARRRLAGAGGTDRIVSVCR